MTYSEKLKIEHPRVSTGANYEDTACPGHYFDNAPRPEKGCDNNCHDCWNTEIPDVESTKKLEIDASKLAKRIRTVFESFKLEGFDYEEAFEFTKIVIASEIQHELSKM